MITSQQLVVRRKYHSRSHLGETIVAKGLCALVNWPSVGRLCRGSHADMVRWRRHG